MGLIFNRLGEQLPFKGDKRMETLDSIFKYKIQFTDKQMIILQANTAIIIVTALYSLSKITFSAWGSYLLI